MLAVSVGITKSSAISDVVTFERMYLKVQREILGIFKNILNFNKSSKKNIAIVNCKQLLN